MTKIVILGAGGLAREVLDIVDKITLHQPSTPDRMEVLGFIDENPVTHGKTLNGRPVLGDFSWFSKVDVSNIKAVCGIGNNEARRKVTKKAEKRGIEFVNVIHPNVQIGYDVELGKGVVICAGVILTCNIRIGNHVYINLDCTIGHDSILEDYVNLAPSVNVSGNCKLLEGVHVFTNAVVIPPVTVGKWSTIGAGAIVLKDVPDYSVAVGVPAKVIKSRNPGN
jgi:sugar O-acyltransferase (sialic acid O-acetyltransferase NeuD family)